MPSVIEAIDVKRKMYFEFENAPYHCLDVEVSKPTARGGQTLVRLKMRNLLTRAVFDKTFKAGEKFGEPDLEKVEVSYQYSDGNHYHFMDQTTFDTLTLSADALGEDRLLLADNLLLQVQKYNGNPIGLQFPPIVQMPVTDCEPGVAAMRHRLFAHLCVPSGSESHGRSQLPPPPLRQGREGSSSSAFRRGGAGSRLPIPATMRQLRQE